MKNRFAGQCKFCAQHVAAGAGIYDTGFGAVTCTETVTINDSGEKLFTNIKNVRTVQVKETAQ